MTDGTASPRGLQGFVTENQRKRVWLCFRNKGWESSDSQRTEAPLNNPRCMGAFNF